LGDENVDVGQQILCNNNVNFVQQFFYDDFIR